LLEYFTKTILYLAPSSFLNIPFSLQKLVGCDLHVAVLIALLILASTAYKDGEVFQRGT